MKIELFVVTEPPKVGLEAMKTVNQLAFGHDITQYSLHIFRRLSQVIEKSPVWVTEVVDVCILTTFSEAICFGFLHSKFPSFHPSPPL